ncbi:MAG: hypothetical protein N3A62_04075 [Thermodesulfovibrionales bacterium]|nr:hypothetical protein [Thermodesulfovibrionales bacterium]
MLEKGWQAKRCKVIRDVTFVLLVSLMFVTFGCGSSSNNKPLTEQFPTIAKHAQLNEQEFNILLDSEIFLADANPSSSIYPLDTVNIKNMTIGARVSSIQSGYLPNPIFDIALLDKDSLLDKNLRTASQAKSEITLSSKMNANQESGSFSESAKASFGTAFFKASVAQSYSSGYQNTNSTGAVSLTMSQNQTGAYIKIITDSLGDYYDFTPYLIGSKLDNDTVNLYVNFVRTPIPNKQAQYISQVNIKNNGTLTDMLNVYGNMQLLKAMIEGFSELKKTYITYQNDTSVSSDIKNTMYQNMLKLRNSINYAIKKFYKTNGDSFVSYVELMNYAFGRGVLNFGSQSGISTWQWGVSASASYQGAVFGGGGSATVQQARQSGWASAFKNSSVTAVSFPAGVVDTTAWATQIQTMLSQEQPINVPSLNLPQLATITLPDPIGPVKQSDGPPDSCFKSYDDWKKYKEDMRNQGGANQDAQQANNLQNNVDQQMQQNPQQNVVENLMHDAAANNPNNPALYRAYKNELTNLKEMKKERLKNKKAGDSNIVRIDNLFVSGFKVTSYDSVLPLLRPDLSIPGESQVMSGYPNVIKLSYVMSLLGDLDNYLRFLSIYSVSGVTKDMSNQFSSFYNQFVNDANDLINVQISAGHDIPNDILSSFSTTKFGTDTDRSQSDLNSAFLGDTNAVQYVIDLMRGDKIKVWRNAPGGYLPFTWSKTETIVTNYYSQGAGYYSNNVSYMFDVDPPETWQYYSQYTLNPIGFYDITKTNYSWAKSYKTPWYPVYKYRPGVSSSLLFLQNLGPYQLVIGEDSVIKARLQGSGIGSPIFFTSINPYDSNLKWEVYYDSVDIGSLQNSINWNYALYFDNLPKTLLPKFNVLTVSFDKFVASISSWGCQNYYCRESLSSALVSECYVNNRGWREASSKWAYDMNGNKINLKEKYPKSQCVLMLLPLNDLTTNGLYKNAFMYGSNLKATDIISNNSFTSFYNMTLFDVK